MITTNNCTFFPFFLQCWAAMDCAIVGADNSLIPWRLDHWATGPGTDTSSESTCQLGSVGSSRLQLACSVRSVPPIHYNHHPHMAGLAISILQVLKSLLTIAAGICGFNGVKDPIQD